MKTNTSPRIAVLSADVGTHQWASLSAEIVIEADGWAQLLPAGVFKARDGRPHDTADGQWHLDASIAAAFISATRAIAPRILIDYDHQALKARENSGPVPAAAWLTPTEMEWREGQGLFIKPDWTDKARELIANKEYAYLSAVFPYDEQGRPLYLRMAALTNDPAVLGMEPLAALSADFNLSFHTPNSTINLYGTTEDNLVNELLMQLLGKLGIELAEGSEPTKEQATAALSALDTMKTTAAKAGDLEGKVAALSAENQSLTNAYNGVTERVAALSAENETGAVSQAIDKAKSDGRIVEAEVEYLTGFGKQHGVAALSAMLDKRPRIAALSAQQTQTTQPASKQDPDLTDEDLAVLSACGLDKETYLKNKEA
ncbi:phage protease [Grimontia hollisae]|uniref:phage protease n=1 Tax=Grimontia hollisae TaxID=673 RepID=UPI000E02DA20|nr:phage protease [Grimontia hollisae]STQ75533.1 Mu-like prophage I protein [Grimontia hollisae]